MKFLYFSSAAADGTTATEEILTVDASTLLLMEANTTTTTILSFAASQEQNKEVDNTLVTITHTAAAHKVVMASIAAAINSGPHSDGFINIADDVNSLYVNSAITSCAIAVVDAA